MSISREFCKDPINVISILGQKDFKPWSEFLKEFKLPQSRKNVDERISTNFLYYRANYVCITGFIILIHLLGIAGILFAFLGSFFKEILSKVGTSVIKRLLVCCIMHLLKAAGVLLSAAFYTLLICGGHMVFRPRNLVTKTNKAMEKAKVGFFSMFKKRN